VGEAIPVAHGKDCSQLVLRCQAVIRRDVPASLLSLAGRYAQIAVIAKRCGERVKSTEAV
jgi:hypothetical protein